MKAALDRRQFGPWALVTGASSGIGKEFARQIAAAGINVVLVARREALLQEVGRSIAADFKVDYRALAMDLSQEGFLERLTRDTNDLDIGARRLRARKLGFRSWRMTVAPRRMSTVSGKRSTTSSSLGASTLPSCRPR